MLPPNYATSAPPPQPGNRLQKNLWKGGGLVAAFFLTVLIGNFFIAPARAVSLRMLGNDFLAFYFAGTCVRTGHLERLYDLAATHAFQIHTAQAAGIELGKSFGPWWNPPFAAYLFEPLAMLPYRTALALWWGLGFVFAGISILLMCRMLPRGWKTRLLVPLLVVTSMPFFQVFSHGQNTYFSLLLLTITVALWRANRALLAGLVCGLLFYKPQLGLVIAIVLCLCQGRRALLGVCITGCALALVNVIFMPHALVDFATRMPTNLLWMQEGNHYLWGRHVTFKGFWRLLFQGSNTGPNLLITKICWALSEAALFVYLARAVLHYLQGDRSRSATDRIIAATILSMPLLMPFYFDYDLLLTSVGAVLYAADRLRTDRRALARNWEDRWLPITWAALFITMEFSSVLSGHTRLHPAVPLLAAVAAMLIRHSLRAPAQGAVDADESQSPPLAAAA